MTTQTLSPLDELAYIMDLRDRVGYRPVNASEAVWAEPLVSCPLCDAPPWFYCRWSVKTPWVTQTHWRRQVAAERLGRQGWWRAGRQIEGW